MVYFCSSIILFNASIKSYGKLISGADSERSRQPKEPRCRCELKDPFSWHSRESGNLPFSHSLGKHLGQGLRLEE